MKRAFTLIDLLIVVAVIAILAAVLFPVFTRARERARQAHCINNLKQLATAMDLYCTDNDDRYPPAVQTSFDTTTRRLHPTILECLAQYTSSPALWCCPSDFGEIYMVDVKTFHSRTPPFCSEEMGKTSYQWPGKNCTFGSLASVNRSRLHNVTMVPVLFEYRPWHGVYWAADDAIQNSSLRCVAYADGHVGKATYLEVRSNVAAACK